jgi:hypothetical protein
VNLSEENINTIKSKTFWEELIAYFPFVWHGPHRKRRVQFFYCCVCIRCRGNSFTELLPSNDLGGYTYRHTDWWEGFMKYTFEMGSGAMIYIPSFIRNWFRHSKVDRGGYRHTQTAWWSHKPTFIFSK